MWYTIILINALESRLMKFAHIVQQLHLPTKKLVLDYSTY